MVKVDLSTLTEEQYLLFMNNALFHTVMRHLEMGVTDQGLILIIEGMCKQL